MNEYVVFCDLVSELIIGGKNLDMYLIIVLLN